MAEIRGFIDGKMVNTGGGRRPHVARVAYRCDRSYLDGSASAKGLEMSATLSTATISRPLVLVALLVGGCCWRRRWGFGPIMAPRCSSKWCAPAGSRASDLKPGLSTDDGANVAYPSCPFGVSRRACDFSWRFPFCQRATWDRRRSRAFRDRRPVQADRSEWKANHRTGHAGTSVPGVLRLYPLSRHLPGHPVRCVGTHARTGQGRRPHRLRCSLRWTPSATRRRR